MSQFFEAATPVAIPSVNANNGANDAGSSATGAAPAAGAGAQPTINHRLLLSLKEAAKIIGTKGSTISRIRATNSVKIGISEKVPGCSDRILSCAGNIINVANAVGDIVDVLNKRDAEKEDAAAAAEDEGEEHYYFHFLNHILPAPSKDEIRDLQQLENIGYVRLIVANSHISSIIGKAGATIKFLINKHGVKIVASKDFLPDSDERIIEIQGFPGSITNVLIEISEIILNDVDVRFNTERSYFPHLKKSPGEPSSPPASSSTKIELKIPELYVGAIIGRGMNRIKNLKTFTKTNIVVERKDDDDKDENFRKFIITSKFPKNVKLAESMLLKNLNTEIEKRENYKRKLESSEGHAAAAAATEHSDFMSSSEEEEEEEGKEEEEEHDNEDEQ